MACAFSSMVASGMAASGKAAAHPFGALRGLSPNERGMIASPLRYSPEGEDFVITNGAEFFNRPLYGGNTAFRADAGDKPECVLYLPGRGGNLRFGIKTALGCKWLHAAAKIVTHYRPGMLLYEISDPLLGEFGSLKLELMALAETEGVLVRAKASETTLDVELVWCYGGMNGQRGTRDGDIGTERVPISEWFQLQPEFCRGNVFSFEKDAFVLRGRPAVVRGVLPVGTTIKLADARDWGKLDRLLAREGSDASAQTFEFPVVVCSQKLGKGVPLYMALQRLPRAAEGVAEELDTYRKVTSPKPQKKKEAVPTLPLRGAYRSDEMPEVWARTELHFASLRKQMEVETPDPFLNAAAGALNVAADAVWDEPQGVVMHGAIAWRSKLLGWRGPYSMDALGWHERARRHFAYWATRQNTAPIPEKIPPADVGSNLARSEAALHSNGDMSNSHYDMNLVYIDALFRHLRWTGDLAFARQMWPFIERHLAWERRLFRREMGSSKTPIYEGYAAIWASDDLQYHGGGATHATAYNYFHNREAGRLARLLGLDATPYEKEAEAIAKGIREWLWIREGGGFGEFRDLMGGQLLHANAGLWSFYHTLDSGVPTQDEAEAMVRKLAVDMPRIPVTGQGVPSGLYVMPTTTWMPYTWSLNNVVMGENLHTALGLWLAGERREAYRLTRGAIVASMFMGICPGNVGTMNYLDVYRREAQRDFADGGGVLSRTLVEGLFGIRPDILSGELLLVPGWPEEWTKARLRHAKVEFGFERNGKMDTYRVSTRFGRPVRLRLSIAERTGAVDVRVNGEAIAPRAIVRRQAGDIEITTKEAETFEILVRWDGQPIPERKSAADFSLENPPVNEVVKGVGEIDWSRPLGKNTEVRPVPMGRHFNDVVTAIFEKGKYVSPRSPYCSLALPSQGIGAWAGHVNAMAEIDDSGLRTAAGATGGRISMPNGVTFETPGAAGAKNVLFVSQWDNYPREATIPLQGRARWIALLMAGSTNAMQSRFDNGEVEVTYRDGGMERLRLHNPTNWWPIEQDYFLDDYAFRRPGRIPPRVELKSGKVRMPDQTGPKGRGGVIPGGAATVLLLPVSESRELEKLTVRAVANEVVIGLMAATLVR